MVEPGMRPEFQVRFDENIEALWQTLKHQLNEPRCPCEGQVFRKEAVLWICERQRHFWSPYLYLRPREDEHGKQRLHGRFAPHPHVWTLFMAMYGILILVALGGLVYGASQQLLNYFPWAYVLVPFALGMMAFVYGAAFIGQGLGAEQMYQLRSFIDQALKETSSTTSP